MPKIYGVVSIFYVEVVHFVGKFCIFAYTLIQTIMEKIIKIFEKNKGYARMKDLRTKNIHPRDVTKALSSGIIEKIKPGLYKLVDYPWDEHGSFVDVCKAYNKAVICLVSASSYYDLTTFNPAYVTVAVPHNSRGLNINYPPVQVYYFPHTYYNTGITDVETQSGIFRIYETEKTLCDLFRYRQKIGEDIMLESLKNYLSKSGRDINKLMTYADELGVKEKMLPYVKAMV